MSRPWAEEHHCKHRKVNVNSVIPLPYTVLQYSLLTHTAAIGTLALTQILILCFINEHLLYIIQLLFQTRTHTNIHTHTHCFCLTNQFLLVTQGRTVLKKKLFEIVVAVLLQLICHSCHPTNSVKALEDDQTRIQTINYEVSTAKSTKIACQLGEIQTFF